MHLLGDKSECKSQQISDGMKIHCAIYRIAMIALFGQTHANQVLLGSAETSHPSYG